MDAARLDVAAYLHRIGLDAAPRVDADGLRNLQNAHLLHVPFENLDIWAGRRLSLELEDLQAKLIGAGRGGFCYELNGLFAALLEKLGFRVARLGAETWSAPESTWGPPLDHLVLRVELDDPWLVDVGFGDAFRDPLRLQAGRSAPDHTGRTFELSEVDGRWVLAEHEAGAESAIPKYRFSEMPYKLADFTAMCHYQETESPWFTGHRLISIPTPAGRHTLIDDRLILHSGTQRTERIVTEEEIPGLLDKLFGVVLNGP